MIELVFTWLLGATIVFVFVAMTGEAREPHEARWLLVLAALWPLILLFFVFGSALTLVSALLRKK